MLATLLFMKTKLASPATLESRNDEQTATDRNQVLEQSNVEICVGQGSYEPSADVIAGENQSWRTGRESCRPRKAFYSSKADEVANNGAQHFYELLMNEPNP